MPERAPSQGGSEKSAAAVLPAERRREGPNGRRVSRPCISTTPGGRSPGNRSSREEAGVKPRGPRAASKRQRRPTISNAQAHAVNFRTAVCGPACTVVWEGYDRDYRSSPIPITPSMGTDLEVKVLPQRGHSKGREPQPREGDRAWEGSGKRNGELTNRNRI